MSTVDKLLWYMFVLSALLIAAVYFIGVSTDAGAVKDLLVGIFNTVTGRPAAGGAFGGYPGGATQSKAA